jgi:hypothetical protein
MVCIKRLHTRPSLWPRRDTGDTPQPTRDRGAELCVPVPAPIQKTSLPIHPRSDCKPIFCDDSSSPANPDRSNTCRLPCINRELSLFSLLRPPFQRIASPPRRALLSARPLCCVLRMYIETRRIPPAIPVLLRV